MKALRRLPGPSDLIPTESMADIAFLLIVFFMITVTFSATKGLDFASDPDESDLIEPVESVLVRISADGSLIVDERSMPFDRLLPYLAPKLARNPGKPVIIQPDPQAPYGAMIDVYDELRQGKEKLGLAEEIRIALPTQREAARLWR